MPGERGERVVRQQRRRLRRSQCRRRLASAARRRRLRYWCAVRFRTFRMTHQTKFVMKPPASTTISTGRFCHRSLRSDASSCARVACARGAARREPVGEARAHDAAERRDQHAPREVEFRDRRLLLLRRQLPFLGDAGQPADRDPDQRDGDAGRMTCPDRLPAISPNSPLTIGGTSVPKALHRPSATATPSAMPR